MQDIKISLEAANGEGLSILRVDGVVDTMTASELEKVMNSLLSQKRYRIVVDLAGVEYISSAGWGIFVSNIREVRANRGDIKLARMMPSVYEVFELLEFDSILRYVDQLPNPIVPGYVTVDLRLAWRPTRDLEVAIVGQNLLDNQHAEFAGRGTVLTSQPKRSAYGKLTWRF